MSIKLLLMQQAAATAYMEDTKVFMGKIPTCNLNGDFSHNIKPYHSKLIRKGAGKKKLSKKQRKSQKQ